ncbi:MAG: ABC transporter substrate-binding protein, partial [Candidatus Odinarchaeota archaeon]
MNLIAGNIEKSDLDIRFIPILCSAPLIYAQSHGFFQRNGLNVNLHSVPGWSAIKELLVREKIDAAHVPTPMPIASTIGIDGLQKDLKLCLIQNVNGLALTLSLEHQNIKLSGMKNFNFGVPYRYSVQYYLLCHLLAQNGVDPLNDVKIIEVSPPRMPYYLEKGWVDGFFAPEPYNQIAVYNKTGFIHTLSKDIWHNHPCCSFSTTAHFSQKYPNTYRMLLKSILEAQWALHTSTPEKKKSIAKEISGETFLNVSDYQVPVKEVLTGEFPDGLGNRQLIPDRIDFIPYPREKDGIWILTQMQRWHQLHRAINYHEIVQSIFDSSVRGMATDIGFIDKSGEDSIIKIAGELFDVFNAFNYMQKQPYSSFKVKPELQVYKEVDKIKKRIADIADKLAEVAGGDLGVMLEMTSSDEIGILEQVLNESILNLQFSKLTLEEDIQKRKIVENRLRNVENQLREIVSKQEETIIELSTPVIKIHDGILVVPVIGTLDSDRAQDLMEKFLQSIVETKSEIAIIDITGAATFDINVARYIIDTVNSIKLVGAIPIITGISPSIAQTVVQLGIDMRDLNTFATLANGLTIAYRKLDIDLVKNPGLKKVANKTKDE